jgi:hypothetical protein
VCARVCVRVGECARVCVTISKHLSLIFLFWFFYFRFFIF